jgi:putative endonuclease
MAGRKARSAFFAPEVPTIHVLLSGMMSGGFIYIMSNRRNGTLYVGVTSDLVRRCYEHRNSLPRGFTKQYGLKKLVYFERHDDIRAAIQREKAIKHWSRAWKVRLIHAQNPDWRDLFEALI